MNKYKEYLEAIGIISEEDFNEVLEFLPKKDFDFKNFSFNDILHDKDSLAEDIISNLLENWEWAYVESCNIKEKTLELGEVQSSKDLDEIKEFLSPIWTISNYESLKSDLLEDEEYEKNNTRKIEIVRELGNLELEILESIYSTYVNNKK